MKNSLPVNCLHAKCPSCGADIDVIPAKGTVFIDPAAHTPLPNDLEQAVIRASLPVHESFEPFIFNDKPDKPFAWDESIAFAQANYCSLDPNIDNTRKQMREKAVSAWSFQSGAQFGHQHALSTLPDLIKKVLERAAENAKVIMEPERCTGEMWPTSEVDKQSILDTKFDDLIK